jgi:hypothetical protein
VGEEDPVCDHRYVGLCSCVQPTEKGLCTPASLARGGGRGQWGLKGEAKGGVERVGGVEGDSGGGGERRGGEGMGTRPAVWHFQRTHLEQIFPRPPVLEVLFRAPPLGAANSDSDTSTAVWAFPSRAAILSFTSYFGFQC